MTDIAHWLSGTHRAMGHQDIPAGKARTAILTRVYPAEPAEVWDACTDPARVARWFLPVSGDLREGGTFALEGNAHGEIVRCDPPRELVVSWIFGDHVPAEVRATLTPTDDGKTLLRIVHASVEDVFTADPDTGIWPVGSGWDVLLWALDTYLRGGFPDHRLTPEEMAALEPTMGELAAGSIALWAPVIAANAG